MVSFLLVILVNMTVSPLPYIFLVRLSFPVNFAGPEQFRESRSEQQKCRRPSALSIRQKRLFSRRSRQTFDLTLTGNVPPSHRRRKPCHYGKLCFFRHKSRVDGERLLNITRRESARGHPLDLLGYLPLSLFSGCQFFCSGAESRTGLTAGEKS